MNSLYEAGVTGKLYRLWFELNNKNRIKIKTGVGMSQAVQTGANIGQGTIGGALIRALNLSNGVQSFFMGSPDEISYGQLKLEPLIFQDDLARLSITVQSAQAANDKIDTIMGLKQLQLNIDKSCFILIGNIDRVNEIRNIIAQTPLTFKGG